MQLGVGLPSFSSDHSRVPRERLVTYAQRAESYGFSSVWVLDHLRPPSLYTTSWLDPITTLSTVAGATETISLGTSIVIMPLRNPIMLARRAASLQHLSDGRLTLGAGLGSDQREYEIRGVDYATRSDRFTEGLELMLRLFDEDTVSFEGEHFSLDEFRLEPALARPPRVLVGGSGIERDDGVRRMARTVKDRIISADGWVGAPWGPEAIESDWADVADHAAENGREPRSVDRAMLQYVHLVPDADEERALEEQRQVYGEFVQEGGLSFAETHYLTGTIDDIQETLSRYEEIGIRELVLQPVTYDPAEQDRQLELINALLQPHFR